MSNEYMTINADGKEVKCRIIFTYESKEYNHKYVIFEYGDTKEISAMIYTENDGNSGNLMPVQDDKEWDMLEEVVNQYFEEHAHHHHHHEGCSCDDCDGCGCGEDSACGGDCDCDHDHDCDCDDHHECGCHHNE